MYRLLYGAIHQIHVIAFIRDPDAGDFFVYDNDSAARQEGMAQKWDAQRFRGMQGMIALTETNSELDTWSRQQPTNQMEIAI